MAATTVRLALHDCIDGCDGCLNFDVPQNAGLDELVDLLNIVYFENQLENILSLSDFYALLSTVALEEAIQPDNEDNLPQLEFPYYTGRVDDKFCGSEAEFPNGLWTSLELRTWFNKTFRFSTTVAFFSQ